MEVFELEGTRYTPKVVFDLKNKVFEISGDSRPVDLLSEHVDLIFGLLAL